MIENELIRSFEQVQGQLQQLHNELVRTQASQQQERDRFKQKIIQEFNGKLTKFKNELRLLRQENDRLKKEIAILKEVPVKARETKSEGHLGFKKRRLSPLEKVLVYKGEPFLRNNYTETQLNEIPTQYSSDVVPDSVERPKFVPVGKLDLQLLENPSQLIFKSSPERASETDLESPLKGKTRKKDSLDLRSSQRVPTIEPPKSYKSDPISPAVVEDSQDEYSPIPILDDEEITSLPSQPLDDVTDKYTKEQNIPEYNKKETALQRRVFLRKYFDLKFHDKKFRVDLSRNPITEQRWILEDFVPNPKYIKPKINAKITTMTKKQQQNQRTFFEIAGRPCDTDELSYSQIFDKFPSPPGFMDSDFPSTQEQKQRNAIVEQRQHERIQRRLASVLVAYYNPQKQGEFIFYEDILNKFVSEGRFIE